MQPQGNAGGNISRAADQYTHRAVSSFFVFFSMRIARLVGIVNHA